MSKVKLTPAQHNVLVWLNDQGDRVLYGPMSDPRVMKPRGYGFAGSGPYNHILMATGNKLFALGMIQHVRDKYPLGYYAITDLGRAALAEEGRG